MCVPRICTIGGFVLALVYLVNWLSWFTDGAVPSTATSANTASRYLMRRAASEYLLATEPNATTD